MPATALRCRVCETQFPLDPIGVCARCFGPLDPVYDRDEQRRTVTRESIAAGPQSIWRYAPLLPVAPPAEETAAGRLDAAHPRPPPRGGARRRRALAEARHGEPDALVQGSRRRGCGGEGDRARPHDDRVLVDGQPRERRRRACRGGRARGGRAVSRRSRAGEADRDRGVRREDLRRRGELRRLLAVDGRAVVRARLGVRERRASRVLRGRLEDARVRDRRAARLGAAGCGRRADRVGRDVLEGASGLRRAARARSRRRNDAAPDRRAGGRLLARRDGVRQRRRR